MVSKLLTFQPFMFDSIYVSTKQTSKNKTKTKQTKNNVCMIILLKYLCNA